MKTTVGSVQARSAFVRHAGYTIDQTILIVAIIAILITIIIATVGWDLINRTGGAKLAAQMRQIEDAAGQFYATHNQWPHQAINVTGATATLAGQSMFALTGAHGGYNGSIAAADLRNHVSGFRTEGTGTAGRLIHDFAGGNSGDNILLWTRTIPASTGLGTNTYLIVEFQNVPTPETLEADEAIDGDSSATAARAQEGRVFFRDTGSSCSAGGVASAFTSTALKSVCYAANLVQ